MSAEEKTNNIELHYPAVFDPFGDRPGYTVTFPDLLGCVTEGDSLEEAVRMAEDAAIGWVLDELRDGRHAPTCSDPAQVHTEGEQFVRMVELHL